MDKTIGAYAAAGLIGVTPRTIYRWVETGFLTPVKPGRPLRFDLRDVQQVRFWRAQAYARSRGAFYQKIMEISGRSYDTARIWVRRRRARGQTRNQIVRDAEKGKR